MRLSDFFGQHQVIEDANVSLTHYSTSNHPNSVVFALNTFYLEQALANENVSAVITTKELACNIHVEKGLVISDEPKKDFFLFHNYIFNEDEFQLVKSTEISDKAKISSTAIIKENVIIEDDVIIEDYAVIEENSILRKGVFIGSHAVIGARGMHNSFIGGEHIWVKDVGGVILEEGVQVLSHATIQKPYFYELTRVSKNSIVSLQCNIGHGCQIGENTLIAGNAQLAGYIVVGNNVWIGPSSTVAHGLEIGSGAKIMLGSVVINNIKKDQKVSGNFALNHMKNIRKLTRESK
jgi:UDP-3-O-[3-hydroxymyristoyl] glucosamine N-acyltransferase